MPPAIASLSPKADADAATPFDAYFRRAIFSGHFFASADAIALKAGAFSQPSLIAFAAFESASEEDYGWPCRAS